jgi:fido (protein-threonine AMPylation protein)
MAEIAAGLFDFERFSSRSAQSRYIPNQGDLKTFHHKLFRRVVPLTYYAGNFRCNEPNRPCLATDVAVDGAPGTPFSAVPAAMAEFSQTMKALTARVDKFVASNPAPEGITAAVTQLIALLVGKFIQIHPFVNGNGRISRLLANFYFLRYGFDVIFPAPLQRPEWFDPKGGEYGSVMAACMVGDFNPLYRYLLRGAVSQIAE